MGNFKADFHEPSEILSRLEQVAFLQDLEVSALNDSGWADYYYTGSPCYCHNSTEYNCERKTWRDLLDLESVEAQLQNQLIKHPTAHHRFYLEGVAEPAVKGIYLYSKAQGQNVFRAGLIGERQQTYKQITNWLHQIGKYWEVVQTASMAGTANAIAANYEADQREENSHGTLKRMFKPYDYHPDPQVMRIMGGAGDVPVGPKLAEAIIKKFGTSYRAWKAPMEEWLEVPGIGNKLATNYLRGIGRGDV